MKDGELLAVFGVGVVTDGYADVRALAEGLGGEFARARHAQGPLPEHGTRFLSEHGTPLAVEAVAQHDALAQLALRAGHETWTMAGLAPVPGERVALLFVSSWGTADSTVAYLESMLEAEGRYASPRHFSRSVYSSVASIMAIHFKIHGPCETLAFANDPVRGALRQARRLLARGRADRVLVVWAEQASEIAQDLARRAARQLGRMAYRRYEEKLGFGAVAVVVGPEASGGGNVACQINPEDIVSLDKVPGNLPFAMDGALAFVASILQKGGGWGDAIESGAKKDENERMIAQEIPTTAAGFDVELVRADFPILQTMAGSPPKRLVYLDNGATTQKPRAVIDAIVTYYETQNANIHRGVYSLSQTATGLYEKAREKVRAFIHAREAAEVIFTRGTTESINLVASSWGRANLAAGDLVVVSHLEHHSNIVPWQMVCAATGAELKVIPINDAGELELGELEKLLKGGKVRMVAVNHISNSLGTINPVKEIIEKAHAAGALVLVDGAQWVAHAATDVQALGADFYAFSGHKMMGPTGVGVLYGKRALLEAMPPYQGGGDMIESVQFEKTTYAGLPNKFEAGTPDIAGVVGLGAAVDYLTGLGLEKTGAYERELLRYATGRLGEVPGLRIIGNAREKSAVISFVMDGFSTLDIGMKLDKEGICVRTGHHCCQPVMERYGIGSTVRASFAFYNTRGEVDRLVEALQRIAAEEGGSRKLEVGRKKQDGDSGQNGLIAYPKASAKSVAEAAAALAEEFAVIGEAGGAEGKSEYVLEMAKGLPHLFNVLEQVTTRVPGCMSQVYLVGRTKPGDPGGAGVMEFVADADAEIVRGLIAILERLYSGQKARDVLAFDIEGFFQRIGLDQFITSQRRNGLAGMVGKIRGVASEIAATTTT